MAASAALFAIFDMFAGMIDRITLTCRPMIALKRIARLVRSSSRMARASAAWSSNESWRSRWGRSRLAKKMTKMVGREFMGCLIKGRFKGLPHRRRKGPDPDTLAMPVRQRRSFN